MKILIIQQKMIGDVLTSTILLEALRDAYPDAELHYLINKNTQAVVKNNPFFNKLVLFTPEIVKSKIAFYRFLKSIEKERYDVVIDVYGKLSSLLITYFSKAKKRIAYHKKHTSMFYTHTVLRKKKSEYDAGLAIENRMKLLALLNIPFEYRPPKIYLSDSEKSGAKSFLLENNLDLSVPILMISVLGSSKDKTYPAAYMAEILDFITETAPQSQLLFNYIPSQREAAKEVYDLCKPKTREQIRFSVFAKDLRMFIAITSYCRAIIGNEGGAIHMAKAVGVPSFAIFSPFINIENWFGNLEKKNHFAVHLKDFVEVTDEESKKTKKQPQLYYNKFKPAFIIPELKRFLATLNL